MLAVLTCFQLLGGVARSGTAGQKKHESLLFTCATPPFLSVSVSTVKRTIIPTVEIKVRDPHSREQGVHLIEKKIPRSDYGDVVEIPKAPDDSTERAVEVCGAVQGEYALTVYEHGDEPYRITVKVGVGASLSTYMRPHEGGIRRGRFNFKVRAGQVELTWLDKNGQPKLNMGDDDW